VGYGFIRADTIISTLRGPVFRAVQRLQRAFREKRYKGNFIDCVVAWDLEVEEESEAEDNHGSDVDDSRPVPPWRPEVQRKLVVCRHWLNIRCTPGKLCRFLHATKKARCRFNPSTVRKAPQFIRPVPKTGINNRRVNRIKRELDSGLEEGDEGPSIPSYESYGLVGAGLDEDDGDGGAAVRGDSPSGDEVVAVKRARRSVGGVWERVAQRCQQKTPLLRRMLVYRFFVIISLEMGQKQTNKQTNSKAPSTEAATANTNSSNNSRNKDN
jgi:hypothetical protein